MTGLYFEDFHEGQTFEHALSRTVTEMDNVLFSSLTLNPQPLHLDEEFARTTEFGQRIVNSMFTLGLMIGMSVGDTTLGTTIANLGMNKVEFPKPVFHGDTIRSCSIVRSVRASKSRPEAGVVGVRAPGVQPARRDGGDLSACRIHEAPPACGSGQRLICKAAPDMKKAPEVALRSLRHCLWASVARRSLARDESPRCGDPGRGKRRRHQTMRHWITSFLLLWMGPHYDGSDAAPQVQDCSRLLRRNSLVWPGG